LRLDVFGATGGSSGEGGVVVLRTFAMVDLCYSGLKSAHHLVSWSYEQQLLMHHLACQLAMAQLHGVASEYYSWH